MEETEYFELEQQDEFEIEDDIDFTVDQYQSFDEYESADIDLEEVLHRENISIEDVMELDTDKEDDEEKLKSIPLLIFVDEKDIVLTTETGKRKAKVKPVLICPKCNKLYERQGFYERHIKTCDKSSTSTKSRGSKSAKNLKKKGYLRLTDDQIKKKTTEYLSASVIAIKNNPIYNIKRKVETPGNKTVLLAEEILLIEKENEFQVVAEAIVIKIYELMKDFNLTLKSDKEVMWKKIHNYISSSSFKSSWEIILTKTTFELTSKPVQKFLQKVVFEIVNLILKEENAQMIPTLNKIDEIKLSKEEEENMSYVSGYIIYALLKKYEKIQSIKKDAISQDAIVLLNSLKTNTKAKFKAQTFLDYVHKWTDIVNKGGLVRVNDGMYIFIRRVEYCVQTVLSVKMLQVYKGEDLRKVIKDKLESDNLVISAWESISRLMPCRNLAKSLYLEVITKWIDIRAKAFVSSYVQIIKLTIRRNKNKTVELSKKAEPSMRKTLT